MTKIDELRDALAINVEKSFLTEDEYLNEYVYYLYDIENIKIESIEDFYLSFYQTMLYMVGYTDMYLIMNHKQKELMMTKEDYYFESITEDIKDFEDVKIAISSDPSFLKKILESILEYNELPFLSRMNLAYNLTKEDAKYLSGISPFFKEEYMLYTKEVELDDYIRYFKDRTNILEDDGTRIYEESIILEIVGFMKNLTKYNYGNYMDNLEELLKYYYSWSKFDVDHNNELIQIDKDSKQIFIDEFENMTISEIGEIAIHDDDFLRFVLGFYIGIKPTDKIYYQNGSKVEYSEVLKYVNSLENPKVKEKLK